MMKKRNLRFKGLAFLVAAGLVFTSCDLLKNVDYTVTPNPLEMHGDSVAVKVNVTIPEKSLNKKAYVVVQPMIGEHALKPVTIVGEKATANGTVIPYKSGGELVYEDVIAYSSDMEVSELTVSGEIYKKGKLKDELEKTKIADATIITPLLVHKDFRVIAAEDQFERVTQETFKAEIHYLKGSPVVRRSQLRVEGMEALKSFLEEAQKNPKIKITGINIEGYASIEGEETENNDLSTNRSKSAKEAVVDFAADVENEVAQDEANYSTVGKGEDFVGFQRSLKESDMEKDDIDRILRIIEMQNSPADREQAIKDLSTYLYLDKQIFPAQRRAEINVNYDLTGFSDEELVELSKTNIDTLTVEEILFTATLTDDLNEKLRLYKEAERLFPDDYRTANNVGVVYYKQNKLDQAKAQFEKAAGIKENPISSNNLAAIAGVNGDRQKAKDLLADASGAGEAVSYNQGILAIQDGNYEDAVANFGGEATFNKALAELLNGQISNAETTINDSEEAETADGYYLKAIISARGEDLEGIISNLKSTFAKDVSYKEKATKDREFIDYIKNAAFTSIIK